MEQPHINAPRALFVAAKLVGCADHFKIFSILLFPMLSVFL